MQKDQMHVGGRWLDAADGEVFESANPYTGKPRALIPRGRAADAERLARIEVTDNGKLIRRDAGLVPLRPQGHYDFGGLADKLESAVIPIDKDPRSVPCRMPPTVDLRWRAPDLARAGAALRILPPQPAPFPDALSPCLEARGRITVPSPRVWCMMGAGWRFVRPRGQACPSISLR
jgi:hypothetical protein